MPRLDVVPWWVRVGYAIPLIDRYAHVWMWAHGGWEVRPPSPLPPGDQAGVREPRQPLLPEMQPGRRDQCRKRRSSGPPLAGPLPQDGQALGVRLDTNGTPQRTATGADPLVAVTVHLAGS